MPRWEGGFGVSLHACSLDMPDKIRTSNRVRRTAMDNISSCLERWFLCLRSCEKILFLPGAATNHGCCAVHTDCIPRRAFALEVPRPRSTPKTRAQRSRLGLPRKMCGESRNWTANLLQGIKETVCDGLDHLRMTGERGERAVLSRASRGVCTSALARTVGFIPR